MQIFVSVIRKEKEKEKKNGTSMHNKFARIHCT